MNEEIEDDGIEFDDTDCPSCGCDHTCRRECYSCYGKGFYELHDEDPLWYDEDATETCGECNGVGWLHWCHKCGYDFALGRRICENPTMANA